MYVTRNNSLSGNFEWDLFFSKDRCQEIINECDKNEIFLHVRDLLKEDKFQLSFVFSKMMKELLSDVQIKRNTKILELGAATGFLTRWLVNQYGGEGTLVDNSENAYLSFSLIKDDVVKKIRYLRKDVFELDVEQKFDIVCSYGLIEHFKDKKSIIKQHIKFLVENGIILISVPTDTPLTRVFMEVHPELNLGYRELLKESELKNILESEGLIVDKLISSKGYVYDFMIALCYCKI